MNKIIRRSAAVILAAFMLVSMTSCEIMQGLVDFTGVVVTEITKTPTSEFLSTFELDGSKNDLEYEELYYDYGYFGDGMALYKITEIDELKAQMEEWDELPLSEEADDFLTSLMGYITLPEIENGNWMFVYREPKNDYSINASLAVYDADNGVVYFVKCDT